jgi:hypothetical protein
VPTTWSGLANVPQAGVHPGTAQRVKLQHEFGGYEQAMIRGQASKDSSPGCRAAARPELNSLEDVAVQDLFSGQPVRQNA